MSFKEGDWVLCVNDVGQQDRITKGHRYIVASCSSRRGWTPAYVALMGHYLHNSKELQNFMADRFVLAPASCNYISDELWDSPMGVQDV